MPLISYPTINIGRHPDDSADTVLTLPVDRTELVLDTPGRVVHESPETRDIVAINRGPTLWFLTLTFGAVEVGTQLHAAFDRWLARMHDLRNYSAIPIGNRAFGGTYTQGSAGTVTARNGNVLTLTGYLSQTVYEYGNLVSRNIPVGTFITVGGRLVSLESIRHGPVGTGHAISCNPVVGNVGDSVSIATTVLCRLAGDGRYRVASSGGLTEPLTVPFQEVLF